MSVLEYKVCSLHNKSDLSSILFKLTMDCILGIDLYVTFRGTYIREEGPIPVVIKLFTNTSDTNNEFEVLEYLQEHSTECKHLYPKPYLCLNFREGELGFTLKNTIHISQTEEVQPIHKIIVYSYIPGRTLNAVPYDKMAMMSDISKQLSELHSLGFVYADIKANNIIKTPIICGRRAYYVLIDFGRTFSISDKAFPPMKFMISEGKIPSQKNDLALLKMLK